MKKVYEPPVLEFELYVLNTNIASHCGFVVTSGPEMGNHEACEGFIDPTTIEFPDAEINAPPYNVDFYDDTNCDCYTTGGVNSYWQS